MIILGHLATLVLAPAGRPFLHVQISVAFHSYGHSSLADGPIKGFPEEILSMMQPLTAQREDELACRETSHFSYLSGMGMLWEIWQFHEVAS